MCYWALPTLEIALIQLPSFHPHAQRQAFPRSAQMKLVSARPYRAQPSGNLSTHLPILLPSPPGHALNVEPMRKPR
jgi:hypothetical protein